MEELESKHQRGGAAQQRILALFKTFYDEARVLKHSESIAKDRSFWLVGAVGG